MQTTIHARVETDPEPMADENRVLTTVFRVTAPSAHSPNTATWYTVRVRRALALNVMTSIKKGEPVIITGELTAPPRSHAIAATDPIIEATVVGHDLTQGVATFSQPLSQV